MSNVEFAVEAGPEPETGVEVSLADGPVDVTHNAIELEIRPYGELVESSCLPFAGTEHKLDSVEGLLRIFNHHFLPEALGRYHGLVIEGERHWVGILVWIESELRWGYVPSARSPLLTRPGMSYQVALNPKPWSDYVQAYPAAVMHLINEDLRSA